MARAWLKENAPGLHKFLTRQDKPYPLLREALVGVLLIAALLTTLFAATAQPFPRGSPVVVVTTGSMMHCTNGHPTLGRDCDPTSYGRIGTIDPGDLIFVRKVTQASDVVTKVQARERHYGDAGDVVVYHRDGSTAFTPIIHRALFLVTVEANGQFSVPDLGIVGADSLDQPAILQLAGCTLAQKGQHPWPAGSSGFITRGDNNPAADQCPGVSLSAPARVEWLLGKARGELPWVGLVKLFVDDLRGPTRNFTAAGGDSKVMLFVSVGILVALPYGVRALRRSRHPREPEPPQPPQPPAP